MLRANIIAAGFLLAASPLAAKDDLGVFDDWGAFRDLEVPRCYAIAKPAKSRRKSEFEAFASIGTWPRQGVRGQVHFRLSRAMAQGAAITLRIGNRRFDLVGSSANGWAADKRGDAAIVAAMRAGSVMYLSTRDTRGNRFTDQYSLAGAATAMDAATIGCARLK